MFNQKFFKFLTLGLLFVSGSTALASLDVVVNQIEPKDGTYQIGGTVKYEVVVTNNTDQEICEVILQDSVAPTTGNVLIKAKAIDCKRCKVITNQSGFTAAIEKCLEPGCSITFFSAYKTCSTGDFITNTAFVGGKGKCGKPYSNSYSLKSPLSSENPCAMTVSIDPAPGLNVSTCIGGTITVTATPHNNCSEQLTYTWTNAGGTVVFTGNPFVWSKAKYGSGQFTVTAFDSTVQCPSKPVTTGNLDEKACSNFSIEKTNTVDCDTVTYTISVTNNGPQPSTFDIRDCLPDCLKVQSVSFDTTLPITYEVISGCTKGLNDCVNIHYGLPFPSEGQGSSLQFTIVAKKVKKCGKCVSNTAIISSSSFDCNILDNSSTSIFSEKNHSH